MRQIKFRGKRVDNGEWVYGFLIGIVDPTIEKTTYSRWLIHNGVAISQGVKVNPSTVGQFTGLIDKNGKEIWEGDIVTELFGTKGIILFKHCSFMIEWKADVYSELLGWKNFIRGVISDGKELEVISNIHDNPSLLTNK